MTKSDWFCELQSLGASERKAALDKLLVQDPELGKELQRLLCVDTAAIDLMDQPCVLSRALSVTLSGKHSIANYELLSLIGVGGMGEVWRARKNTIEQNRDIAIKVIKLDADNDDVRRRFKQEQQTLLRLDHPNIVHLFDTGTTDEGRPWIAMEYVDGLTITEYCTQNKLPIVQRLKLFQQVGVEQAVVSPAAIWIRSTPIGRSCRDRTCRTD